MRSLTRFFKRSNARSKTPAPTHDFWYSTPGVTTLAGVPLSERDALKYLTVYGCVALIAGDIARLPLHVYKKRKSGGKDVAYDHWLYDFIHTKPNPHTTSFAWRESALLHLLLWGDHYTYIERNLAGGVKALWQKPDPNTILPKRVGNQIKYEFLDVPGRILDSEEVFHIPGLGFNGLKGLSVLATVQEALKLGMSAERFGANFFEQGTHPSAVLEMDGYVGQNRKEYLAALKAGYQGLGKTHEVLLLEYGMKWKPLTMPLNDSQFLETRQFQKTEICGFYAVPPHKVAIHGENSNYSNLEQENASYVDSCLMRWITRFEANINTQLLTEKDRRVGYFAEFLVQGLLRGDSAARSEYYNKMFKIGAITPNEIREKENMNPIAGGDQAFVMLNLVPLDKAEEMAESQIAPEPEPEQEPEPPVTEEEAERLIDWAKNTKHRKEYRSIVARDRIANRFEPLIKDAAQAIVSRETIAIKRKLGARADDTQGFAKWLEEYYNDFPEYIRFKIGGVLRAYMLAIIDEAVAEIGTDAPDLDTDIAGYIDGYAQRHTNSSLAQMVALLDEGDIGEVEKRADEWHEKRADKIATDEKVRANGAAYSIAVFAAGLSVAWRIRGKDTCPYCTSLNGKTIKRNQAFVKSGDTIKGDGQDEMKVYGLKTHPPLHGGCDCYLSAK